MSARKITPDCPIDLDHLSRQTMGDKVLEREVMTMFAEQCEDWAKTLQKCTDSKIVHEIAHQIKGCALSVGAAEMARIANILEDDPKNDEMREQVYKQCLGAKEYIDLQS